MTTPSPYFQSRKLRILILLVSLFAFNALSASIEALGEPARRFPKFNDDELWVIKDKSTTSSVEDLEKRLTAAQIKLDELEKSQRTNTRDYADALFDFVELYDLSGNWANAVQYTNRLIIATKRTGGPMSVGICYKRLAYYYFMEEKLDEAVASANTSIELLESEYDRLSPALLLDLQVLGDIYTNRNDLENARRIYERMLAVTESGKDKEANKEHAKKMTLDFAKASAKLADIYRRQGKLEESEKYYRQGISVVKATIGTENAFLPKCMYGLSLTLLAEKKLQEADALLNDALPLAEASLGNESGLVGAIMQRLNKGATTKN